MAGDGPELIPTLEPKKVAFEPEKIDLKKNSLKSKQEELDKKEFLTIQEYNEFKEFIKEYENLEIDIEENLDYKEQLVSLKKDAEEKMAKYIIDHLNDGDESISTNQIVRLTEDLAGELIKKIKEQTDQSGILELNGLEELDEATAKKLIEYEEIDWLYLDGLNSLDKETALVLCEFKGNHISLNGLKEFNEGVENLKSFNGEDLYLKGITSLTEENVEDIKEFEVKSISLGEIKDSNIIELLSSIDGKEINFEKGDDGEEENGDSNDEDGNNVEGDGDKDENNLNEEKENNDKGDEDKSKFEKIWNNITNWFKRQWENLKNKERVKSIRTKINEKLEGKSIWDFIIDRIFK